MNAGNKCYNNYRHKLVVWVCFILATNVSPYGTMSAYEYNLSPQCQILIKSWIKKNNSKYSSNWLTVTICFYTNYIFITKYISLISTQKSLALPFP